MFPWRLFRCVFRGHVRRSFMRAIEWAGGGRPKQSNVKRPRVTRAAEAFAHRTPPPPSQQRRTPDALFIRPHDLVSCAAPLSRTGRRRRPKATPQRPQLQLRCAREHARKHYTVACFFFLKKSAPLFFFVQLRQRRGGSEPYRYNVLPQLEGGKKGTHSYVSKNDWRELVVCRVANSSWIPLLVGDADAMVR